MKTLRISLMVALASTLLFASCKKYEEGPAISLRSKKERVANTWEIEKAMRNGQDVTSEYDQFELQMLTDGDASLAAIYTFGSITYEYQTNGTWQFANKKEQLELDFEDNDADRVYNILKLKETELWIREQGGEDELQLKPK